ncbi:MAG: FKBP-type peptidyl-prolyl cis-trans isomerase [Ancrocorticia sp.]
MRQRVIAALAAAGLAVTLSGCGGDDNTGPKPSQSPTVVASVGEPSPTESAAPKVVVDSEGMPTVEFGDGGVPTFTFPEEDAPDTMQVSVLEEGSGRELGAEDFVVVNYVGQVWDADKPFDSSFKTAQPAAFSLLKLVSGWRHTLSGRHVGDKVIISLPPEFGYGANGQATAGIGGTDTIVFYIEIIDGWSAESAGQPGATVETDGADLPVTITGDVGSPVTAVKIKKDQAAPTELTTRTIAKGNGPAVAGQGSRVFIAYSAIVWETGEIRESTWTGTPSNMLGAQPVEMGRGTVFDSLDGATVGSRVLILVPESDGSDSRSSSPAMAVVVDILGYQAAPAAPSPSASPSASASPTS